MRGRLPRRPGSAGLARRRGSRLRGLAAALAVLALTSCERDLAAWEAATRSPDPYERRLAAAALARPEVFEAEPLRAWRALTALGADPSPRVRERVHQALRSDVFVTPLLLALCHDGEEAAGRALVARGPAVLPRLVTALGDPRCAHRVLVARSLAALGPAAVPWLAVPLCSKDLEVRAAALVAVETLGPRAAHLRPFVLAIRDGSDGGLRLRADAALAALDRE